MRVLARWFMVLVCVAGNAAAGGGLSATNLRCEYLVRPQGVHEASPRLSWIVTSDQRGARQSAYRVLVASSAAALSEDRGDLWDSGRVESAATAHIAYAGLPLESRQRCHWKVMAWDGDGVAGAWSMPGEWEMGLLRREDWSASWVEAAPVPGEVRVRKAVYHTPDRAVEKDVTETVSRLAAAGQVMATNQALGGDPAKDIAKVLTVDYTLDGVELTARAAEGSRLNLCRGRIPLLRRGFTIGRAVRGARLYATALGVYELTLNGEKIGEWRLAPGWTDYPGRVRYQVYDVTGLLKQGPNMLGAVVAPGWYSGHTGLFNAYQYYGATPALLAQLELQYDDGTTERIVSDESWRMRAGPILGADILKGEMHDARARVPGWDRPGGEEDGWTPVTTQVESRTLLGEVAPPVSELMTLPARAVTEPAPGRWVFDLGQNMVGVVRLRVRALRGTVVTLRHAEILNTDGTIYTRNLRAADSTDTYICAGGEEEVWQPLFTFHGFRYVEVTGLPEAPGLGAVTGVVIGSDLPPAGDFSCSDSAINQLQSNIVWGLRGNYLSVPTDCPQRDERMGWMADAQVFQPTATYNADIAAFMTGWVEEIKSATRADGAFPDVAPVMKGLSYGTPAWGDAGVIVPWLVYQYYGDRRILERSIGPMVRWVEWCREHSTGLNRDRDRGNDYGDWLSVRADTPKDLIGTAYFAHSADLVARSLRVLGREEEARTYEALFDEIRAAFNARYVAPDGLITGNTQCCYVIALRFNLLPPEKRSEAARRLVADIAARGGHLSTGFVGVSHLLPVLTEAGHADVAQDLLAKDTFPSWLFSVRHGATTIWERWDGWTPETGPHPDFGMNSFNHYSLGSCGQWMFESAAGIGMESPGFGRILIRPRIGGNLDWVRGSYRSIRGEIASAWKVDGGRVTLLVTIPANTTATVYVPGGGSVTESGVPAEKAAGVMFLRRDEGATVFEVGSGRYEFVSELTP